MSRQAGMDGWRGNRYSLIVSGSVVRDLNPRTSLGQGIRFTGLAKQIGFPAAGGAERTAKDYFGTILISRCAR
jgi:hypothetical protein